MTNDLTTHHEHSVALREATELAGALVKHQDRISEVADFMKGVTHRHYETKEEKIQVLTEALETFDTFTNAELPIIEKNLELGMTTPSTVMDQMGMVGLLVGCFPNTNKEDRSIVIQQLTLFLEEFGPTATQLALAFRWLVRHCKFLPVIASARSSDCLGGIYGRTPEQIAGRS
jgi:hypothetical protein